MSYQKFAVLQFSHPRHVDQVVLCPDPVFRLTGGSHLFHVSEHNCYYQCVAHIYPTMFFFEEVHVFQMWTLLKLWYFKGPLNAQNRIFPLKCGPNLMLAKYTRHILWYILHSWYIVGITLPTPRFIRRLHEHRMKYEHSRRDFWF